MRHTDARNQQLGSQQETFLFRSTNSVPYQGGLDDKSAADSLSVTFRHGITESFQVQLFVPNMTIRVCHSSGG